MRKAIRCRRWEIASKRNIFRRCVNAHVGGIPVLPEPLPMKCENDNIEVYPGQDPATVNSILGQHAAHQAIDKAVEKGGDEIRGEIRSRNRVIPGLAKQASSNRLESG